MLVVFTFQVQLLERYSRNNMLLVCVPLCVMKGY
jgi:hypothetical protein